jgi:hypothetical protein
VSWLSTTFRDTGIALESLSFEVRWNLPLGQIVLKLSNAHVELFFPRRFEDEGGSKKNNEKRPRFQKIFVSATGPFSLHEARAAPKSVHDRTGERPRDAER